jgi:hypothetical protein
VGAFDPFRVEYRVACHLRFQYPVTGNPTQPEFAPACQTLPNLSSGMEQTLWVEEMLGGVAPGKHPVKCLVAVVKDANTFFAQGFARHDKHSG